MDYRISGPSTVTVGAAAVEIFGTSLTATSERNEGDRPANIIFTLEGGAAREAYFAELRFDEATRQLVPVIEIGRWQNLILVMGLRKWLIFGTIPLALVGHLDLNRSETDDTGFYRISFHIHNGLLIAVYESGIAAISCEGNVAWQRRKHWDDELLQVNDKRMIFLTETGQRFAFDCRSGEDVAAY